jgi:hypothetical protein
MRTTAGLFIYYHSENMQFEEILRHVKYFSGGYANGNKQYAVKISITQYWMQRRPFASLNPILTHQGWI